ncbi:tripartite tricarboxylate transporter TctB family protein [uncultured Campylobacter sp.]|uniref:tripartite tricarboxylate transporter TctB family protein n=1 Tax=uncultured Campylobacter sp. TaxID=218934 RepID=UPI00261E382B|nr:tripartite tricarboxylate transporter TctB family protein [uncultured Campylobacter sp.]
MLSTKIFSVLLLVLSLFGIYIGWGITTEFQYEPLGPRPFPIGALVLIALCSVLLFFFAEDTNVQWPKFAVAKRLIILAISFFAFYLLFEYIGFIISSGLFMLIIALLFGANFIKALIFSVLCSTILYYCFDALLQITLPVGFIFE